MKAMNPYRSKIAAQTFFAAAGLSLITSLAPASVGSIGPQSNTSHVTIPFATGVGFLGTGRTDFARLDADPQYALSRSLLDQVTVSDLKKMNQEQLDQLYARLTAGEFPTGELDESVLKVDGGLLSRVAKLFRGGFLLQKLPLPAILHLFWAGKNFSQQGDERIVQNRLTYGAFRKEVLDVIFKYFGGRLPPRESFFGKNYLRFPGKVFCGSSLLDSRRESIVIDYAYADDLKEEYDPAIDYLTGRNGLMIRNELRMVNRRLYLGRAYFNRFFVFNFVVTRKPSDSILPTAAQPINESCWLGTQQRASR